MPEKEGAEEKTTKSVVNKKQKQMMGEEGYDVARDEGRVKPSKDKKDGTTTTPSKEMEKLRKVNKGPSALERVKADIERRYGKGAIMNVKKKEDKKEDTKEELDLTKVAEAFGGHIVESTIDDFIKAENPFEVGKFKYKKKTKTKNVSVSDKNLQRIRDAAAGKTTDVQRDLETVADRTTSSSQSRPKTKVTGDTTPKQGTVFGGQDDLKTKRASGGGRPRGSRTKIKTSPGQQKLDLGNVSTKTPKQRLSKSGEVLTDLRTVGGKRKVAKKVVGGPTVKQVQKKIATDAAAKAVAKRKVRNVAMKQVAKKAATKAAVKGTAAAGGKFLAKRIPGVGAAISGAEAMGRLASGDVVGAALAGAEGIASFVPGLGTAASAGLGAINVARDVKKATRAAKTVRNVVRQGRTVKKKVRTGKQFTQAFRKSRKIKKKMNPLNRLTTPDKALGTSKGNKIKDAIVGKTPLGRFVRGATGVTGVGDLTRRALMGAGGAGDALGHVGRRSAGK